MKKYLWMLSVAVVIGTLRVKFFKFIYMYCKLFSLSDIKSFTLSPVKVLSVNSTHVDAHIFNSIKF